MSLQSELRPTTAHSVTSVSFNVNAFLPKPEEWQEKEAAECLQTPDYDILAELTIWNSCAIP